MAIINKTGITDSGIIQAEHITRTIDALSGIGTDTIIATGSFSGSLVGVLTGTASFATTASFALNVEAIFPFTGAAEIDGTLEVIGDSRVDGNFNVIGNTVSTAATAPINISSLNIGSVIEVDLSPATNRTLSIILDSPTNYEQGSSWSFLFIQPASTGNTILFELGDDADPDIVFGSIIGLNNTFQRISNGNSVTAPTGSNHVLESKVELIATSTMWYCRVTTVNADIWELT